MGAPSLFVSTAETGVGVEKLPVTGWMLSVDGGADGAVSVAAAV